jgi:hypothetical protein
LETCPTNPVIRIPFSDATDQQRARVRRANQECDRFEAAWKAGVKPAIRKTASPWERIGDDPEFIGGFISSAQELRHLRVQLVTHLVFRPESGAPNALDRLADMDASVRELVVTHRASEQAGRLMLTVNPKVHARQRCASLGGTHEQVAGRRDEAPARAGRGVALRAPPVRLEAKLDKTDRRLILTAEDEHDGTIRKWVLFERHYQPSAAAISCILSHRDIRPNLPSVGDQTSQIHA